MGRCLGVTLGLAVGVGLRGRSRRSSCWCNESLLLWRRRNSRCCRSVAVGVALGVVGVAVGVALEVAVGVAHGVPCPWHQVMIDIVNAPTLIGALVIASHPPPQPTERLNRWYVHHRRDKTFRVAAPSPTTCNRTATISADGAVIAPDEKAAASRKDILKRSFRRQC